MSIEDGSLSNLEQASDGTSVLQKALNLVRSVWVVPSVPMTEKSLFEDGYAMFPCLGIEIDGKNYEFNNWPYHPSHNEDIISPTLTNSRILEHLSANNISYYLIEHEFGSAILYIKYPETETPETQVEYEI